MFVKSVPPFREARASVVGLRRESERRFVSYEFSVLALCCTVHFRGPGDGFVSDCMLRFLVHYKPLLLVTKSEFALWILACGVHDVVA